MFLVRILLYAMQGKIYRFLVGKPEVKRPLGRSRRGLEDNIKMDLLEVGYWGYELDRAGSG